MASSKELVTSSLQYAPLIGLVIDSSGTATVLGGEDPTLAAGYLPGDPEIYYAFSTASTYVALSATVPAWNCFIATAAP